MIANPDVVTTLQLSELITITSKLKAAQEEAARILASFEPRIYRILSLSNIPFDTYEDFAIWENPVGDDTFSINVEHYSCGDTDHETYSFPLFWLVPALDDNVLQLIVGEANAEKERLKAAEREQRIRQAEANLVRDERKMLAKLKAKYEE